jgi:hypothetical protein
MDIENDILQPQIKSIFNLLYAKDCFELKLHLLKIDYINKNECEQNDIDLERIKCEISISRLKKEISLRTKELKDNLIIFEFSQEQ